MKQVAHTFSILSLLIITSAADLAWEWKNPLPAGFHLNSISVLNEHTAIAAGEHGVILKTSDGTTWDIISNKIHSYYRSTFFIDSLTGWVFGSADAGNKTVVLRTSDGGTTWTKYVSEGLESYHDIFFVNKDTGWFSSTTQLFKTIDGGENWQEWYTDTNHTFYTLYFIHPDTGWVSGSAGTILKTTDGGTSWTPHATPDDLNNILDIFFINADTGWAVGGKPLLIGYTSVLLKTVNGGETWKIQTCGGSGIYESVYYTDSNTGWICTHLGNILKTNDGGSTWEIQIDLRIGDLTSLQFTNNLYGYCVGFNGRILKTSDGDNWEFLSQGEQAFASRINTLLFTGEETGWAGGYWHKLSISNPILYKTSYAGERWEEVALNTNYTYFTIVDISFTDPGNGWVLLSRDTSSLLLITYDSGATWKEMSIKPGISFKGNALFSLSPDTGFVIGKENYTSGKILQTTDGGTNWQIITIDSVDTIAPLEDIQFINRRKGWAVGGNGTVVHTDDGGVTWHIQNTSITSDLCAIQFINDSLGWAVGFNKALTTTNGGLTWIDKTPGTTNLLSFTSLYFTDSITGWITTNTDTLLFTDNGGNTWKECPVGIGRHISTIYSRDGRNIWAGGDYATILHSYYEGSISIKDKNVMPSMTGVLVKHYPNPVTEQINFTFSLRAPSAVSLALYSLSGKRVAALVNKQTMNTGQHSLIWNRKDLHGQHVPPGVYFSRLTINSFVIINRLILL